MITTNNITPLIQVLTWFFLCVSAFSVLARGITKTALIHEIGLEDHLIVLAFVSLPSTVGHVDSLQVSQVFSIGQSIAVSIQCVHGFGKHMTDVHYKDFQIELRVRFDQPDTPKSISDVSRLSMLRIYS